MGQCHAMSGKLVDYQQYFPQDAYACVEVQRIDFQAFWAANESFTTVIWKTYS